MPGALNITPRLLYKEDFATTTTRGETTTATIMGLGSGQAVSKVDAIFLSDLTVAANDAAAAAAGIPAGAVYYNSTYNRVHARLS